MTGFGSAYAETVRMATMSPVGSPSRFVYDRLLDAVSTDTKGLYTIEPFFNGELGPEESYFNAMRRGRIQLSAVSGQAIGTAIPEYAVLRAPYLFDSFEELAFIYDTYLTGFLSNLFHEKDIVHLQWAANGWENLYAQKPVLLPGDIEDYRIRVPLEPNAALFFGAAGADVIQIPFTDIIQSLQTGLIDGGESTTLMYVQAGIFSEAPHLTRTQHGFSIAVYTANKKWFDGLSPDTQHVFRDAYIAAEEAFPILEQQTNEMLALTSSQGVIVHDLNPQQRQQWRSATARAVDQIITQVGGQATEFYDLVMEGKKDYTNRRLESKNSDD